MKLILIFCLYLILGSTRGQIPAEKFNLDKDLGYAVVLPWLDVAARTSWNPGASDVTMIVRAAVWIMEGWFDALSPYTAKTKGSLTPLKA